MKAQKIKYYVPESVKLTGSQLGKVHTAWKERWSINRPFEDMTDEDILIEAEFLGFIELPAFWRTHP